MPAAVFFDVDDTPLNDTGAKRAYLPQLSLSWRDRLPHADFRAALSDEVCDALIREFLRLYEANWRLFDDVVPALDALAHYRLGVITNGVEQQQRDRLARTGIAERFAVIWLVRSPASATPSGARRIDSLVHLAALVQTEPD